MPSTSSEKTKLSEVWTFSSEEQWSWIDHPTTSSIDKENIPLSSGSSNLHAASIGMCFSHLILCIFNTVPIYSWICHRPIKTIQLLNRPSSSGHCHFECLRKLYAFMGFANTLCIIVSSTCKLIHCTNSSYSSYTILLLLYFRLVQEVQLIYIYTNLKDI